MAFVVANPHALLSFSEFWTDVAQAGERRRRPRQARPQPTTRAFSYYLWVLTWGIGWVPAIAAAVGGPVLAFRARRQEGRCSWSRGRCVFILYMGLQDRYFGRWLLPALPAIALLAAFAAVELVDRVRAGAARCGRLLVAGAGVLLVGQGLVYSVHLDRVLSRDDTRNLARAWMVDNVPRGSKIVVEPIVPDAWTSDAAPAATPMRG